MSPDSDMHGDVVTGRVGLTEPDDLPRCGRKSPGGGTDGGGVLRMRCMTFGGIRSVKSSWQVPPTPLTDCTHICNVGIPQARLPLLYIAQ